MNLETRRSFFKRFRRIALAPLLAGGGAYGYGSTLERHRLVVESHELQLALGPDAPRKLRAVALSDFHYDPLYETAYAERCVRAANELDADIVFLTGDFVSHHNTRLGELSEALGALKSRHGIFACLGNHDHKDDPAEVIRSLKQRGIETLVNQRTHVRLGGGELIVAGLQSACDGYPNWPAAARGLGAEQRALVLMHEPDYAGWLSDDKRIAFQLSGHTHGGQVCIPGVGALRLPRWGLRYPSGFFDVSDMKLYVTRGVGTVHVHVRLFCPPEITCFDITNTDATA